MICTRVYILVFFNMIFKWFIPIVCDCNIKYQKDIGWVRQNTTLYYGVGCPKGTTCFGPLL